MKKISNKLVIVGYIFLTIFIIALISFIKINDCSHSTGLIANEVEVFNEKFSAYEGENVLGIEINSLIQIVIASNQKEIDDNSNHYVEIKGFGVCTDGEDLLITKDYIYNSHTKVLPGNKYTVELQYDNYTSFINKIIITKNQTTTQGGTTNAFE